MVQSLVWGEKLGETGAGSRHLFIPSCKEIIYSFPASKDLTNFLAESQAPQCQLRRWHHAMDTGQLQHRL